MIRFAAASAAVAVAILSAGAASAAEHRIAFGDLDLATPQGAATFDRRVWRASLDACISGSALDQAHCRRVFAAEARTLLPEARRADYARARLERTVVRTPVDPN